MKTASPVLLCVCAVLLCAGTPSPGLAQGLSDFGDRPTVDVVAQPFTDAEVARLMALLSDRLKSPDAAAPATADAILTGFVRRLQQGQLTRGQETQVRQRLDQLAKSTPALARFAANAAKTVASFTVGKPAPEISGRDLDGLPLKLSDLRGKVVVLTFSGEWCGICRSEYPYHRLLLDLYKNWPFAIVSVESGRDPAAMKHAKTAQGLVYRSWWDAVDPKQTDGPIAASWNVTGWPTVYVLDGAGVIRFVDVRKEDLLKAVRQLLTTQVANDSQSQPKGTGRSPE